MVSDCNMDQRLFVFQILNFISDHILMNCYLYEPIGSWSVIFVYTYLGRYTRGTMFTIKTQLVVIAEFFHIGNFETLPF